MTFYAFGVNHLQAPVEVREAFALGDDGQRKLYRRVTLSSEGELIVLSTCNRTEAYLYGSTGDVDAVREALSTEAGQTWPHAQAFHLQDEDAVRHVLEVAAGLKSLVLGDAQIFSQLKEAYRIAVEEERVGTTMHRLMHTAFRTAKRVINETDLNTGAESIPFVAVNTGLRVLSSIRSQAAERPTALVVGSGAMGRLAVEALKQTNASLVSITNRSETRGKEIAARVHVDFIPWKDRHRACCRHDLVIVATSAESPVILAERLRPFGNVMSVFVDISVPRNVETGVADLGHTIIDMDDLNERLSETEPIRRTAIPAAGGIVREMLGEFVSWVFHHQALQPVIQTIADTFETIRANEVERHHQKLAALDRVELDRITLSIVQKILAIPVVRLKSVEPESIDFVQGIRLLHALFRKSDCEDSERSTAAPSTPTIFQRPVDGPREVCPIDLPSADDVSSEEAITELELDDVLRLFSLSRGDVDRIPADGKEQRTG